MKYIVLTWVNQGTSPAKQHRHFLQERMKRGGMKHKASFLSAYYQGSMGYLPGLLQGIPLWRSTQGGGWHTPSLESMWPLINKELCCYFHMHVFACADYVTDDTHIVASHCTLQLRDTAPQLKLLWFIGWYIIHHPCSCNKLLPSAHEQLRKEELYSVTTCIPTHHNLVHCYPYAHVQYQLQARRWMMKLPYHPSDSVWPTAINGG